MKKHLVIVESPAKARTLSKILGKGYSLKASLGHIRDLPRSQLGVDIDNDFSPKYVVPMAKRKVVRELKEAAKTASSIYLATDHDREGEAISWHLAEVTKSEKTRYHRVVFHEITKEAIEHAFRHPLSINMQLVDAQQARRILDRLVGYKISPLLWRKVRRGLSAGRVQSVALKIIVDREREIEQFVRVEYWTIEAELTKQIPAAKVISFQATLNSLFDSTKLDIHNQQEANEIKDELELASYSVTKVKTKEVARQPAPPFITSTLQQEAWRKLRFTAKQTMAVAQQLYEGLPISHEGHVGLITYMRTDSTQVARSAITETREFIASKYGPEFVPQRPRSFTRVVKGAQEAHEAIRPTRIHREPSLIKQYLSGQQFRLYELIWKRMVASQMSSATFDNTTVDIKAKCPRSKIDYLFRTSSSVSKFPGFIILYTEGKDEANGKEDKSFPVPQLKKGDKLDLMELFPEQHFTQPPPRFTEASLIKTLEQWGIGRPSTYAPILSTIQERGYVTKPKGIFKPTEMGILVTDLISQYFSDIVNVEFTARMEDKLDEVALENKDWVALVRDFYGPFENSLQNASQLMDKVKLADELTEETCPQCGKPIAVKHGRYGKFLACSGYPECKYTKPYQVKTGAHCPECGSELVEKISKKKRTFYGCSNYPNCQFATNSKPLPQPCPKCSSLLTLYRQKWAKCTKCTYKSIVAENPEKD
ncbi:type I DNA topoisomerase [Chloroflexota bacterium]